MRYFTIISLFVLVGTNCLSGQSQRQIKDRRIHSSSVKTIDSRKSKSNVGFVYSEYDKRGNVVLKKEFNADSVCIEYSEFLFDRKGHLIEEVTFDPHTDSVTIKILKVYDKWGKLKTTEEFNAEQQSLIKTFISYNNIGDKISEEEFDANNVLTRKSVYEYDKIGLILSKKIYDRSGQIIYHRTYVYR